MYTYSNWLFGYMTIKDSKYIKINSITPLYLLSEKWMDTLKILMKINI